MDLCIMTVGLIKFYVPEIIHVSNAAEQRSMFKVHVLNLC